MNENNWVRKLSETVSEKDLYYLEKAKKDEQKKLKKNWRHFKINNQITVIVPFGKDGKPTEDGWRQINAVKKPQGIK